MESSNL
jgi:hypothetical protein